MSFPVSLAARHNHMTLNPSISLLLLSVTASLIFQTGEEGRLEVIPAPAAIGWKPRDGPK